MCVVGFVFSRVSLSRLLHRLFQFCLVCVCQFLYRFVFICSWFSSCFLYVVSIGAYSLFRCLIFCSIGCYVCFLLFCIVLCEFVNCFCFVFLQVLFMLLFVLYLFHMFNFGADRLLYWFVMDCNRLLMDLFCFMLLFCFIMLIGLFCLNNWFIIL